MTRSKNHALVSPFPGLRPAADKAPLIAAPPYDVVSVDEARAIAKDNPLCFLHVSRAEIDLPSDTDPYDDAVYEAAGRNLRALEEAGALIRDPSPSYYVYRMTSDTHVQTGFAVSASVDAYLENRIRKHELTRPTKEDDRVRQIEAVDAATGPVLTVHRANAALDGLSAEFAAGMPDAVAPDVDGVRHELWTISDRDRVAAVSAAFAGIDVLYIADGHHRSAAGARVAEARRAAQPDYDGSEPWNGFLAVTFPDSEVRILDYNRVVADLAEHDAGSLLAALERDFHVRPADVPVRPGANHTFGMYLAGNWYELRPRAAVADTDPVERLDVRVLDRMILGPLLGIGDNRTDPRIDFVGGSRGLEGVAARVDSGSAAVGFTLFPTSLADLMAVADAGAIMPPKSTWFDPKLADGMISLPLD